MAKLGVDGSLLWYDRRGTGPTVMFLTGLGGNHTIWNYQVQALRDRYECILHDYRGTGASSVDDAWRTKEQYTLKRLALDVLSILDTLDISHVHLVGTSMGGVVAQLLATEHPERIRSLSLHSTWARRSELARVRVESWIRLLELIDLHEFLAHLAPWIWSDRVLTKHADRINAFRKTQREHGARIDRDVYVLQCLATLAAEPSQMSSLESVAAPTLVTCGTDDLLVPRDEIEYIGDSIEASSTHWFDSCGHAPYIESPDEFSSVQAQFLDRVEDSVAD